MKRYVFFFHWNKAAKKWSIHWKKQCYVVEHLSCLVPCESKINKRQPYRVMRGLARYVDVFVAKNGEKEAIIHG